MGLVLQHEYLDPALSSKRKKKTRRYRKFMRRLRFEDNLRLLKHKPGAMPRLIVIGAQKAGTTSLHKMLVQHPQIWGSPRKEIHFFNDNFFRGERWYRSFYPPLDGRVFLDTTPCYLCHPFAAERMTRVVPDARIVVLLREPAARALSQYWMEYMRGEENLEIEKAFASETDRLARYPEERLCRKRSFSHAHFHNGYFWRGLYADQLERYFRRYDRSQILIQRVEEFGNDPKPVLDRICDLVSIDRFTPKVERLNRSLVGDVVANSPSRLYSNLLKRYEEPNRRLESATGIHWRDMFASGT